MEDLAAMLLMPWSALLLIGIFMLGWIFFKVEDVIHGDN